ncbi:hypothetical protein [Bacillus thermotolerans]|uniref:Hydrolase n=1 Tax=Bacillus thermotolerans TaxID=1221996 RepID=A0A0F5HUF4_BACTR|nr:hypothetical protein [Bacillus thermotolerans]KKB36487.1 hypothetical protein QY97_00886 [Bacillus thermotolerans]KKB41043.1 hypothetical protein QY95_01106 [Bacillus thermotolerans]KKB44891.1 hypothetical protein QY96_00015 [Bacillus thermotolerans]
MEQEKHIYYVDPASREMLPTSDAKGNFRIAVTEEEADFIRQILSENYSAEVSTFARAHVPYLDYSIDPQDDQYDRSLIAIYGLIYKFGDEEARHHIDQMGILDKYRLSEKKDF